MNDFSSQEANRMTKLQLENETLSQQVKSLIKAESKLYEYQEKLDAQLNEYKTLYELNRKISSTFNLRNIFEAAIEYVIYTLEFERVIFLQQAENTGDYAVCALDGFYDPQERENVAQLTIKRDDPILLSFRAGREFLISQAESEVSMGYRARLLMDDFLVYPLGSQKNPVALIVVGNSAENAHFYHRINDNEGALLRMGNLVGLLSSRVENYLFYSNMKKALAQEKQAEAKYRGIFENAAEGIIQVTHDGRLLSCNPAAAAILGYESPEEMIESITDIGRQVYVRPDLRNKMYDRLGKGHGVTNFDLEFYRKDGSRRWVQLSVRPVINEHGEILYADGMILDIAERKRAEKALQEINDELEQRVIARTSEL
jgi:PAS domain S-box-containing protein